MERGILELFVFYKQESDRIQYVSEPHPNRRTHHILVSSPEIDIKLMGWRKEAYWFAKY